MAQEKSSGKFSSKYFWRLDSEASAEWIRGYRDAIADRPVSRLSQLIDLLENKVPVPPKAYLTSSFLKACDGKLPAEVLDELGGVLERFETVSRARLGGKDNPLLLTVQGDYCGAIRNIGVSKTTLPALVHHLGSGTAFSLYADFLESFSTLVLGAPFLDFRKTFGIKCDRERGIDAIGDLSAEQFGQRIQEYQNLISQKIGRAFPESPEQHLLASITRAGRTSKAAGGDEVFVHVQYHRSQFGKSTQGVAYTRNPFTGKRDLYGVYQTGPERKKAMLEPDAGSASSSDRSLKDRFPATYSLVKRFMPKIEETFREITEVEFVTDEEGHLYFTGFDKAQTTARASVLSTVELNLEGKISDRDAVMRIKPSEIEMLLHPTLDDQSRAKLTDLCQAGTSGVTAAPGTAVGEVFFRMADAMEHYQKSLTAKNPTKVILIADELLISDTPGLGIIGGLVTKASGIASHAAVMARANGIPCIVAYPGIEIDSKKGTCKINGKPLKAGTVITLEAAAEGRLFLGTGSLQNLSFREGIIKDVATLISRVIKQEEVPLEIRVNINNAKDADVGLSFGADGVGLCRTENMFMEASSLREIRNIVFTQDNSKCAASFQTLEETQFQDFKKIFEVMRERTVNIRLMDMPLHDLAPQTESDFRKLCTQLKHLDREHLRAVSEGLREHNPMLGLRACRFGIITPEVYDMQIRAIVKAAYAVGATGVSVDPGIMFPLVFTEAELSRLKARVVQLEGQVREELKIPFSAKVRFRVGSMIELPAAALSADQLSRVGEFFAFGTNDLTQTTLGMSRDDSAHYLPAYLEKGILKSDPFKVLSEPVRELVEIAVRRGRRVRPDASFGICGEQGGDPTSLEFCLDKGLDYVSCSPFRVLPARAALLRVALSRREVRADTKATGRPQTAQISKEAPIPRARVA